MSATKFEDLDFQPHRGGMDGVQAKTFFENGYGASVIRTSFSYGGNEGLYELAVLKGTAKSSTLCYATPVTENAEGYLKEADVTRLLGEISALPEASEAPAQ